MEALRKYIRCILEERKIYASSAGNIQKRFDLRSAAAQIANPLSSVLIKTWQHNKGKVNSFASYDSIDFLYNDEVSGQNFVMPTPTGEYFDALPEIEFEAEIINSDAGDVDADYIHSGGQNFEDEGIIAIRICIPTNIRAAKEFLRNLHVELRAAIAHEMQHAVQKVIYGYKLDSITNLDLEGHMTDPMEIDARVEESIAYLEDHISEDDLDEFITKLGVYTEKYLKRNAPNASSEELEIYRSRMMDSHTSHYIRKMGLKRVA
jgi:uncharacterized protein (DUF2267 family)